MLAVKHFRPYLYGYKCEVFTDHVALKSLLNMPEQSGKLARWGMAIQELDLTISYRAGKHNTNVDALSRSPLPHLCETDTFSSDAVIAALVAEEVEENLASLQQKDHELAIIVNYLETGALPEDESVSLTESQYLLQDGVLYHVEEDSTLRIIPPSESRKKLFTEAHGGRFGAHLGDVKVHSELKRHYWWRGMQGNIAKWSRGCTVCATHGPGQAVKPVLTPIPVVGPFDRVGIDVIQFPLSRNGNRYAVVVVDYLTKWPEVFAVPDQLAFTIAKFIVEEVISRHGVPSEILSECGRSSLSGLMAEVEKLLGIKKVNTTAYHPQTDGLVKRYNRTLKAMLAKTVTEGEKDWDEKIPYLLFAYRASIQHSTQESPFSLLYGRDPRLPTEAVLSPTTRSFVELKEYGARLHSRMSDAWELAHGMVKKVQSRQKKQYDRRSRPPNFAEGDRMFLLKPAELTGELQKLARPYHGP